MTFVLAVAPAVAASDAAAPSGAIDARAASPRRAPETPPAAATPEGAAASAASAAPRIAPDAGALDAGPDAGADAGAGASSQAAIPDASVEETIAPFEVLPPPTVAPTRPAPVPEAERSELAAQTILALLGLLVLAYVANHPRVRRIEVRLGLASAITAGFPFVALGLIARHPAVGVLTDDVLIGLTPLMEFGLGWLGFLVGFRLDLRLLDGLPRGAGTVVALSTVVPLTAIALACGAVLLAMGLEWRDDIFLRSGIVLGTAGAMTSPPALRAALKKTQIGVAAEHLDEIVGVVGLAILGAYFRPLHVAAQWSLPGTAWLFVTLGMGATLGTLLFFILRRPAAQAEFMAIALGSVAFAAGMAAYVRLSPLVICFVAGAVIANLPSLHREALGQTLGRLERPIFLVFLTLAGALWDPRDFRGWLLMAVFVVSRYAGLFVGRALSARQAGDAFAQLRPTRTFVAPLSGVAIAVVVNVRSLYPSGDVVPLMLTAVIGGALVAEVCAAFAERAAEGRVA